MITKAYTKFFINILVLCVLAASVQGATVAYWQLDDPDGTIASVGAYNLTVVGTQAFSTTRFDPINNPDATTPWVGGTAADNPSSTLFAGTNAYYIPNPLATHDSTFDFDVAKSFTIEGWISPTSTATGVIIGNTQANGTVYPTGSYKGWRVAASNSLFRFYIDGAATTSYVELTTPLTSAELVHFAGVWDATLYQMRLYINGELRASSQGSPAWTFNRGGELAIGGRGTTTGYNNMMFRGVIDELRFSDTVLTVEEFLYVDPSPITVAYWEFDGEGWDGSDAVGTNDLTLLGTVNSSTTRVNPVPNPDGSVEWHSSSTAAANPASTFFSAANQSVYYIPNPLATHNPVFDFNVAKSFTVEGWFSATSASAGRIVGNITGNSTDAYNGTYKGWDLHIQGGPVLAFMIDGAATSGFSRQITAPIVLDRLTHFTAVWDAVSKQMSLYIDGRLKVGTGGAPEWTLSRGGPLSIGGRDTGTGYNSWLFSGRIDEIRYSRIAIKPENFLNYPFCGVWGYSASDFNEDCYVNIKDFAMLADYWLAE